MKYALYGLLLAICIVGCKKTIEKAQEDAVIDAITSGFWLITKYQKGSADMTNSLAAISFNSKKTIRLTPLKTMYWKFLVIGKPM